VPFGVAAPVTDSVVEGYRVALTPDRLLGRVEAARSTVSLLLTPLGPLVAGVLLAAASPRATIAVVAVCGLGLAVWGTLSRPVRAHRGLVARPRYPAKPMRRYHVTTFGCQMNAHDSERIKGMLEELGLGEARTQEEADVIVLNTCTIREKPDTKFAAYMGEAAARKRERPDMIIAVGGCYAEAQRERLFSLYPDVDVAFGPGTIAHLGDWLGAGGFGVTRGAWGTGDERAFAATLPMHRE